MVLSDVEGYVRQDLFDPAGANQRWQTGDIDRAIDKAVDRYSYYFPSIIQVDLPAVAGQRTYALPTTAWWIEKVYYPLQQPGSQSLLPAAPASYSLASGGNLSIGTYLYGISLVTSTGETGPGAVIACGTSSGNTTINLAGIPLPPVNATQPVLSRKVYRSLVNGATLYYVNTIPDNTVTVYNDQAADSVIVGNAVAPAANTSGVMIWPPSQRAFYEYTTQADGLDALGGINTFTLNLTSQQLPQPGTPGTLGTLRVFYAMKHQLDANGSTIPEIHRDVIALGACAYCLLAYQAPTNDNFSAQDGSLRDKIDDTKSTENWAKVAKLFLDRFHTRLEEIKRNRDFASTAIAQWGDIPARWYRT